MKLSKYKLLTTLFLIRRWGANQATHLISDKQFLPSLIGPNFSQTLSRLKSQGLIESAEDKSRSRIGIGESADFLTITYHGVNDLLLRFPLLDYLDKSWDEKLTLVVFNINERNRQERDRLRYNLKALGFGRLNRSLYLSPHLSVKETGHLFCSLGSDPTKVGLTTSLGSDPEKTGFLAFSVPFESFVPDLTRRVDGDKPDGFGRFWDLNEVADLYERALSYWEMSGTKRTQLPPEVAGRFLSKFIEGLLVDPLLPPSLTPKNWVGRQALEIAKKIILG